MRTAFIETLTELAEKNERIVLVVGDLGFGVVTDFAKKFPKQYINAGVAEQNMTGLSAGLALCGKSVFTYSIANFPTLRCIEQIRNDVCYHNANVKIVAVGGGFAYGALGATHHATEDLSVLRAMPNLILLAPGDPVETRAATRAAARVDGPVYLRLGRAGEPVVHAGEIDFRLGKAIVTRDHGTDGTLISTGGMLYTAVGVADRLAKGGIRLRVLSMHTLKPLDVRAIHKAAEQTGALLTLEEHSVLGGLGTAVAEVLAESITEPVRFLRLGLPPVFTKEVGNQEHLKKYHRLDSDSVAATIRKWMVD